MTALKNILLFLFLSFSSVAFSQEICDNAIDDDGDGLIDLNDIAECACYGIGDTTQTPSSLIPNSSFEEMDCCPDSYGEVDCATGWEQATEATSDYFNTCNFIPDGIIAADLVPFPDGNGCIGAIYRHGWKEYIGYCLLQPLVAETSYTLEFNIAALMLISYGNTCDSIISLNPVEVSIFGNPNCVDFPINTLECPADWILLGSAIYTPISTWNEISITFHLEANINSIMIGPPCYLPPDYVSTIDACTPYFIYDNLILNQSSLFSSVSIIKSGNFCNNNIVLTSNVDTGGGAWQWYRNGIALLGQSENTLKISEGNFGNGLYSAIYTLNGECDIAINSMVELVDTFPFVIPNVFTPNNDNVNDYFLPDLPSDNFPCWEITIYNRWGSIVYKKGTNEDEFWDGTGINGKPVDAGTYFYVMKVNDVDIKHGTVTLIRD